MLAIGTIVKVTWESGQLDEDLFEVVGNHNGKIAIKSLTEVNPITHYVRANQLVGASNAEQ